MSFNNTNSIEACLIHNLTTLFHWSILTDSFIGNVSNLITPKNTMITELFFSQTPNILLHVDIRHTNISCDLDLTSKTNTDNKICDLLPKCLVCVWQYAMDFVFSLWDVNIWWISCLDCGDVNIKRISSLVMWNVEIKWICVWSVGYEH